MKRDLESTQNDRKLSDGDWRGWTMDYGYTKDPTADGRSLGRVTRRVVTGDEGRSQLL